jgi:hypothetical protein
MTKIVKATIVMIVLNGNTLSKQSLASELNLTPTRLARILEALGLERIFTDYRLVQKERLRNATD